MILSCGFSAVYSTKIRPNICNLLTQIIFFLSLGRCQRRTTSGKCCVLPFVYRGRRYTNCARSKRGRPWCPTASSVYKRNQPWGYCRGGKRKYQLSTEVAYLSSSFPLSLYPVFFFFSIFFFPFRFFKVRLLTFVFCRMTVHFSFSGQPIRVTVGVRGTVST